jgi:hypothetical protein
MRYGNPNGEGLIAWPTNTKPNEIMMFGDRIGAQPAMAPDALERFRAFVADGGQIGIF